MPHKMTAVRLALRRLLAGGGGLATFPRARGCGERAVRRTLTARFFPSLFDSISKDSDSCRRGRCSFLGKAEMCTKTCRSPCLGVINPKPRSSSHFVSVPSNRIRLAGVQNNRLETGRSETLASFHPRARFEEPTSIRHPSSGSFRFTPDSRIPSRSGEVAKSRYPDSLAGCGFLSAVDDRLSPRSGTEAQHTDLADGTPGQGFISRTGAPAPEGGREIVSAASLRRSTC